MEDFESWVKECEDKTFIEAIGIMTTKIYDTLEYKKSKSDKGYRSIGPENQKID